MERTFESSGSDKFSARTDSEVKIEFEFSATAPPSPPEFSYSENY